MAKLAELVASLAKRHFDALLFLTGFALALLALVEGYSTVEGSSRITWYSQPRWPLLAVGLVLAAVGIIVAVWGRAQQHDEPPALSASAQRRFEHWAPQETKPESGPELTQQRSLAQLGEAGLLAQRQRIETYSGQHQLLQIASAGRIRPEDENFKRRAEDAYNCLTITNKAILKAVYKHVVRNEIAVDELFPLVKIADDRAHLDSASDMFQRTLLLGVVGLIDVTVIGTRRSHVSKIPAVGAAIEPLFS